MMAATFNAPLTPILTPVITAGLFGPAQISTHTEVPAGLSVLEIVRRAVPELREDEYKYLRITLISGKGEAVIMRPSWHLVRPKPGIRVVIRVIPGKDALRSILLTIVTVAAIALGQAWAVALIPAEGFAQTALGYLLGGALSAVGGALINALIPIKGPDNTRNSTYSIGGWRNTARRDEPIPLIFGRHRYSPPFAAGSYTEIVGNDQYIRAMFCFGYGPLKLDDFKLGDTALADYDQVEIEVREGREDDLPLSLYPRQVVEIVEGIELVRPLPRDELGVVIPLSEGVETPVKRFTASNAKSASVLINFTTGLFAVDKKGKVLNHSVDIRIRQRSEGVGDWQDVEMISVTAQKRESFFRQYTWDLPSRGRWELEITRMSDEIDNQQFTDRVVLAAIQSLRPEYPINLDKPLALVALRIKATHQLNGTVDNFNAVAQRYAQIYDSNSDTWVEGLSRNPAAAAISALTGPHAPYPVALSEIDLDLLADWFLWCEAKDLKYDRVHETGETFGDLLRAICGAGRAAPRHDGRKWGVVIDRPDDRVIDHINPRNSSDFQWSRGYFEPPHAFRVSFFDETNNYNPAERVVPWPGYTGDITLTENLPLPGKTSPDEIWIEARRRMYELLHRPDHFSAIKDGMVHPATRGDLIMGSFDALERTQVAARIKTVQGRLIELDDAVEIEVGVSYGVRFRVFPDPADTIGVSRIMAVTGVIGRTQLLTAAGGGDMPISGHLVHFGPLETESIALKIRGVEAGENFSSVFHMVAAAPIIDELTDAEVPPAWNGRVGAPVDLAAQTVAAPRFLSVLHGAAGTGVSNRIEVLLTPGLGPSSTVTDYMVEHKLAASESWAVETVNAASAAVILTEYLSGDAVDLRATALSGEASSAAAPVLTFTLGSGDDAVPGALDDSAIQVMGGLGCAHITLGTTNDPATSQIKIYRAPAGDALDPSIHAAGPLLISAPLTTLNYIDGDGTRVNLLQNPDFTADVVWTAAANWEIAGGVAQHTSGAADSIAQSVAMSTDNYYRLSVTVSGRTAGSVVPKLAGGADIAAAAQDSNGTVHARLQAAAGNSALEFAADTDFDGALDDVALFLETSACLAQGSFDYYLIPQNDDDVSGPVSGPFNVVIS